MSHPGSKFYFFLTRDAQLEHASPTTGNGRIRSIAADGIIRTIAGNGMTTSSGNEGPAIAAGLSAPSRVRVGLDGFLYVAEPNGSVVRRIAPDGVIHPFAGVALQSGYAGDGGPANAALLGAPSDMAVRPDGVVVIVDNNIVRAVSSNGKISTIAGSKQSSAYFGDNGLAAAARFGTARGIRVAPDGSIMLRVRRTTACVR